MDRALERDHAAASAEYLAIFRSDIENFVNREAVEACVARGVRERAPISGASYVAFVDPSGGSADSMTLAVGHRQDDVAIIDATRERKPPFSPEDVVEEFAALLKSYGSRKLSATAMAASGRASASGSTASRTSRRQAEIRSLSRYAPCH